MGLRFLFKNLPLSAHLLKSPEYKFKQRCSNLTESSENTDNMLIPVLSLLSLAKEDLGYFSVDHPNQNT